MREKNIFTSLFTKGNSDYDFDSNTVASNTLPSLPPEVKNTQVLKIGNTKRTIKYSEVQYFHTVHLYQKVLYGQFPLKILR